MDPKSTTEQSHKDVIDQDNTENHEDGELGEDEDDSGSHHQTTAAARKQAQLSKFTAWANSKAATLSKAVVEEAIRTQDGDVESLKSLLAKQESQVIITNPRDYQMELFERAKAQNTIAVLDTGSGKTLIAVLLLRYVIDQELEERSQGKPKRISFFLVDKVALVFQQYSVLKTNLDHAVAHVVGSMGCHLWSKETWAKHFADNEIIVCTAAVLQHCLQHSFVSMEQINLLIFDEAHHAKKNHPYAKIIGEFYTDSRLARRPKIFGMTASPVDVQVDSGLDEIAMELEGLLDSKIATASNIAALQSNYVSRPEEWVVNYDPPCVASQTQLYQTFKAQFGHLNVFKSFLEDALTFHAELGRWCGDLYWRYAFPEEEAGRAVMKGERWFSTRKRQQPSEELEKEIAQTKEASTLLTEHQYGTPQLDSKDLSSRVLQLSKNIFAKHFETPSETRCLVFVERRVTAHLLKAVFDHVGGPNMRCGILVGSNAKTIYGYQATVKQQVVTLAKFNSGELNCLFATSVAEEGLDISSCNVVVRFDLCKTMIQYIQSRGRARHRNSNLYHMVEQGNSVQRRVLQEVKNGESAMSAFCNNLPKDRLIQTSDDDVAEAPNKRDEVYIDPSTGAKLTYDFSLLVLAHFVASLPNENDDILTINYICSLQAGRYMYEAILPIQSPVRRAIGKACRTKRRAKRSAAFNACLELRKGKYLDENLLPIYTKMLPALSNARLALMSKRSNMFRTQLKPLMWESGRGSVPEKLYLTAISLEGSWDRPVQPLGLLTRDQMPQLPHFPLFKLSGDRCRVITKPLKTAIAVDATLLDEATNFTLVIMKDIFNKTFEKDVTAMSYWLVPLLEDSSRDCSVIGATELIDKTLLTQVSEPESIKWCGRWTQESNTQFLSDRFLVDPFNGGKRYFTRRVLHELKAFDPVPEDSRFNKAESILASTVSLWKASKGRRTWDPEQPVIEAEAVMHRLNVLADPTDNEKEAKTKCYICPEPLDISRLPVPIVSMAMIFPAIIHRVESYLTALDLCGKLHLKVRPDLALEAVTKDSDNTDEVTGEKINFQRGMGPNYERLEFLGDCFLKMATTISTFVRYAQTQDEHAMHCTRMAMLCNKSLLKTALDRDLPKYIRGLQFSRRTWYPKGLQLLGGKKIHVDANGKEIEQPLSEKTIADVCESLIGAAFLTHFTNGYDACSQFDNAVQAVAEFANHEDHAMRCWADYSVAYNIPKWQTEASTASQRDLVSKVELEYGYRFTRPRLLRSAFTHPSYPSSWEGVPSYDRLEFLGDSLLDMTAVAYLYLKYPTKDPQWLTEHKMAIVSNKFLGAVCVNVGLHKHLRHNDASVQSQITSYVEDFELAKGQSNGARDYWTDVVKDPPKCLADVVESYVGAMFVDSNFDYGVVQKFFDDNIQWFFEDMTIYDTFASNHPMRRLHGLLDTTMGCRNYRVLAQEIPSADGLYSANLAGVIVHEEIVGEGLAASSRAAKIKAALDAFEALEGLAPVDFREKCGCNCKGEELPGTETEEDDNGTAI